MIHLDIPTMPFASVLITSEAIIDPQDQQLTLSEAIVDLPPKPTVYPLSGNCLRGNC